jgi:hypothetical protein
MKRGTVVDTYPSDPFRASIDAAAESNMKKGLEPSGRVDATPALKQNPTVAQRQMRQYDHLQFEKRAPVPKWPYKQ